MREAAGIYSLQHKHHQPVVLQDAAERGPKVPVQADVVVEPPEGRPCDDEEPHSTLAEPLEFTDSHLVVRRWSPVLAISLEERDGASLAGDVVITKPSLVNQCEGPARRDHRRNVLSGQVDLLQPLPGALSLAENSAFELVSRQTGHALESVGELPLAEELVNRESAAIERVVVVNDDKTPLDHLIEEVFEAAAHT